MRNTEELLVIFGGTGDLSNRKLIPAVYNLYARKGSRHKRFRVLVIGRRDWGKQEYIDEVKDWVEKFARLPFTERSWQAFSGQLDYYQMDFTDPAAYDALFDYFETYYPGMSKLFYYAVAPRFFGPISKGLARKAWLPQEAKLIIEKPFGENIDDAKRLYHDMVKVFGAEQIYHIDHYLGKEMIQNILTLRFRNMIFCRAWNRDAIESVEITASEQVGVETRGDYYDRSGAMRDMVQNHLFQILSILTMEKPENDSPYAVMVAQQNVLQALKPVTAADLDKRLVMAQYDGYRAEPKVDRKSKTETYAALVAMIDNPRWQGVPFFIRTGKRMKDRLTQVVINFKKPEGAVTANRLLFYIQPDEGVKLSFNIKEPGLGYADRTVAMDFCQSCDIEAHSNTPEAYERLLGAAADGQRFLFSQWPQIEFSWSFIDRVIELWQSEGAKLATYEQRSNGPQEAADMLAAYHSVWYEGANNEGV
ncbi:MAG: glucose-6-phosphate dehydrogenase [Lachnospiraceae bacterium]|nr:glucose-6-phosphate dehydrogenase [Lachnospiraceae bacterium]MDY5742923.1 glucose-6-phosphate dehydrogenase [Lachnospiraceae bacterium]